MKFVTFRLSDPKSGLWLYIRIVFALASALLPPLVYFIGFGEENESGSSTCKKVVTHHGSIQAVPFVFLQEIDGVEGKSRKRQLQRLPTKIAVNQNHSTG